MISILSVNCLKSVCFTDPLVHLVKIILSGAELIFKWSSHVFPEIYRKQITFAGKRCQCCAYIHYPSIGYESFFEAEQTNKQTNNKDTQ